MHEHGINWELKNYGIAIFVGKYVHILKMEGTLKLLKAIAETTVIMSCVFANCN